jgi:PST family polysaccharide transporter
MSPSTKNQEPGTAAKLPSTRHKAQSTAASGGSYAQILRSSSIIGGATGINYIIGLVRTKAVAVLLGPAGVGLVGMYVSITGLVSTIAQLGLDQSGVRQVAEANGTGDPERVARVAKTLRRVCWITGLLGWILTAAFAWPLSQWTFGSPDRVWPIAILGVTVLIAAVTGGQTALLQGMRRIGDLARIQVLSAVLNTAIAIGLYAWLRENGIVPVIILTGLTQLGFSWHFSRKVRIAELPQKWTETAAESKRLISLGGAFMYGAVLAGVVGLAIRALIVRDLGLDANGIYQAAWGLSGLFAGFVLGAMGTDFYPRLTAVAHDNDQVNRLVNEQTEIGILLALPGLLGTLAFAPWLMKIFYSSKFLPGAELLPWFVIGVVGQVISWPLGMIQMAKGATRWMYFSRTTGSGVYLGLTMSLVCSHGIEGVAWAFALYIWIQLGLVFLIALKLSAFQWKSSVVRMLAISCVLLVLCLLLSMWGKKYITFALSASLVLFTAMFSLRGIAKRLGPSNHLVCLLCRVPAIKIFCGIPGNG